MIDIKEGRHPVVEQMIQNDMFISNDTYLDDKKHCIAVITGPNMAGKSTYMRQVALIVLMTQIGSFVPEKGGTVRTIRFAHQMKKELREIPVGEIILPGHPAARRK